MENISYKVFLDFLASDLDEVEYFNCDKKDLVLLEYYLIELKEKHENFNKLISLPLKSIKDKNKWVENVVPRYDKYLEGILIQGKTDPVLGVGIDPEMAIKQGKKETDYIMNGSIVLTRLDNLKLKNRIKVLENSQDEIREIDTIARNLNFIYEKFNTASEKFEIENSTFDECNINCFDWTIIKKIFSTGELKRIKPLMSNETFYKKEGIYPKSLTLEERKKLVKKLYIRH